MRCSAFILPLLPLTAALAINPSVAVTPTGQTTATAPITFTISFSEAVSGLAPGEVLVTGGTLIGLTPVSGGASSVSWTATVTPTSQGTVTVQVPAGMAINAVGESNVASNVASMVYDTPPVATVGITASDATTVTFRVTFNETCTVADSTRLLLSGAAITSQGVVSAAGAPLVYELVATPWGSGTVVLNVGAGTFQDADGALDGNAATSRSTYFGAASTGTEAQVTGTAFLSPVEQTYTTGQTIDLGITFSRPVTVQPPAGLPYVVLNSQNGTSVEPRAIYQSTSGNTLRFRYTVQAGHYTPGLDYVSAAALVVGSGGALVGDDGYLAGTTLAAPGGGGSLRASGAVGVNFVPAKPSVDQAAGPDDSSSCGAGGGVGLILGLLGLVWVRRRTRD